MSLEDDRAFLNSISGHPDRPGDTSNMHPEMVQRLAGALRQARSEGMPLTLFSGFREPTQTGTATQSGRYDARGLSSHSYGLATDIGGLDGANGRMTQRWAQIAGQYGLSNPYGAGHPREFNHWQLNPQPLERTPQLLASLQAARATGDYSKVWAAYQPTVAGTMAQAAQTAPAQLPGTLTELIAQTANNMKRPDLIPIMNGIRAGESLHGPGYDKKDDALESSWGPFQLNRRSGMGVTFEKETGLDVRNAATIPQQVQWVANYLAKGGSTKPWAGYKGPMQADASWGNSGYDPKNTDPKVVVAVTGTTPGAAPGEAGATTTTTTPMPLVDTPEMTMGKTLASLGTSMGSGGGTQLHTTGGDAPAIRMPALEAQGAPTPSPQPLEYQQGHSQLAQQLGALSTQPSPATNELGADSITAGAPSMTAMLPMVGTPAEFNYLDPRRTVAPSLKAPLTRIG